ncbi:ATP-binding protein [Novosphingobium sp. ZW T3_23]|uniref:HAMP domain-containing sensor histidine kinase n=1 Tax=Novosphingobium sp. ZW T3_23 TaxID=3378084 RepID=UPI0038527B6C
MRIGLFGKILIAFWMTLIALGFVLSFLTGLSPYEDRPSARYAPSFLAMLARTVEREGLDAAQTQRSLLAKPIRDQITITPHRPGEHVDQGRDRLLARAPDRQEYVLRLSREHTTELSKVPRAALWGGAISGIAFSIVLALYLSRPVMMLRRGFQKLSEGDLAVRLSSSVARRNDELGDLAVDFDVMAERLGMLVTARDRLLNDVSHELRSPLTRAQLAIGLARQGGQGWPEAIARVEVELRKLDSLVDELLTLAREESATEPKEDFFDPIWVVLKVLDDAQLEVKTKNLKLQTASPQMDEEARPVVAGSARLFERAVDNVVRNAIRFSSECGELDVRIDVTPVSPFYRVQIKDRGPGVDPKLIDTVLQPFVRIGDTGTGLGLAIANRVIRAQGGSITCHNRRSGGLCVTIEIPAISAPI